MSYYQTIHLSGPWESIVKLLEQHISTLDVPPHSERFLHGHRQGYLHFYQRQTYPKSLVGPISFLWKATGANPNFFGDSILREMWIFAHPSIAEDIFGILQSTMTDMMSDISAKFLPDELSRFELTGPRSHDILQSILQLVAPDDISSPINVNIEAHEVSSP